MFGTVLVVGLVSLSVCYIFYYCILFHFCLKEYQLIFEMYNRGKEKHLQIEIPSYSDISFNITYSDYKKARKYNKSMKEIYEEINQLA